MDPISTELRAVLSRPLLWLAWTPAVVISVLIEFLTPWGTPGRLLAGYIVQPGETIKDLGAVLSTALAIDSALCCGVMLGIAVLKRLWGQLQNEVQEQRSVRSNWTSSQRTSATVGSALCALPLSYYPVLALAVLLNRGRLPESTWPLIGAFGVSFAACVAAIYGLFAIAVGLRLRRPS